MFGIRVEELVVILLIIVLLFGGKKIPELSRSIGQSIKELRKGMHDDEPTTKDKKTTKKTS